MIDSRAGFGLQVATDGVAIVTMDMPGQSVNTMNDSYGELMAQTLSQLGAGITNGHIKGIVITSAKKTFFAGGDINTIMRVQAERAWNGCFDQLMTFKKQLLELEALSVPVAAAINGSALGGGFEICLACHHRVAIDAAGLQIGFPEVSLGLLPGAGGIVRTVRLTGLKKAVPILMEGTRLTAAKAKEAGLVDELASNADDMLAKARGWVLSNAGFVQPWLRKGFQIPGGSAFTPANAGLLAMAPAVLRKKSRGLLPAPEAILAVAAESSVMGYQAAMLVESRYFEELIRGPVSAALIGTMYKQLNEIVAKAGRPRDVATRSVKTVGILGAGMMGRGIAYVCASVGINVILKDVSHASAQAGKDYTAKLLDKQIERGRSTAEQRDGILTRITATDANADLVGCDLLIEAVFEDIELKRKLTQELLPLLKTECIFASNTSTLPISLLAEAHPNPERFVGLHFFLSRRQNELGRDHQGQEDERRYDCIRL